MTEKLFYKDSHMSVFTANVISCEPCDDKFKAVLDRTAFFPQGGGQLSDTGRIADAQVLDVQEKEGVIYHVIDKFLENNTEVEGVIDWKKRFSKMQQHSAEHIISGLIHREYGYNNVGFHLADTYCTLDVDGPLTKDELRKIECLANEAVFKNLPIEVTYPSKEELENLNYRSKIEIEGQVRIVIIPGYDVCACCAPHVKLTGEIGLIKFVNAQNYKGGVRITMMSGDRALLDYQKKEDLVKSIMFSLASPEELIAEGVEALKKENALWKAKVLEQQRKLLQMKAEMKADGCFGVSFFEEELEGNGARELMNLVLNGDTQVCAVFVGNDVKGYRYVIGSKTHDVRGIGKVLNEAFHGKGGGKPDMIQGTLEGCTDRIEGVFQSEVKKLRKQA